MMDETLQSLRSLVEATQSDSVVITSSGAEAINHAVFAAYVDITRKTGKNHFVAGALDEAPSIRAMGRLQEMGALFELAPANQGGVITADSVAETLTPRTAMVSLSWACGLTGVIQPVQEIATICRQRGVLFHVDASHVLGRGYYSFASSGADLLTFDGEAIGAPPGVGALYVREGRELSPLLLGGEEREALRAGALYPPLVEKFGQAADKTLQEIDYFCMETTRQRDAFDALLGVPLFGDQARVPHLTAHCFEGATSDALAFLLAGEGIEANLGGGKQQHILHALQACKIDEPTCHTALSFKFGPDSDGENLAKKVASRAQRLRAYSTHLMGEVS